MASFHTDVLIIGAGVSGIGAACRLRRQCPQKEFAILEQRQAIGGTWDLFRYPGVRSDSDVLTFGYDFRPWRGDTVLASGPAIKAYVEDTAREYEVDKLIRFGRKVDHAAWNSASSLWTLTVENLDSGETESWTANFVIGCTGYYDYESGFRPTFPGEDEFSGQIIHPQHWPDDLDYTGKRVVVIGSGATAVTIAPVMSEQAAAVAMLQRSPSYVLNLPAVDHTARLLHRLLPEAWVYRFARTRNILLARLFFKTSRRWPKLIRKLLLSAARSQLGDDIDMRHFTPTYKPWDQRVCFVPDGDLFKAVASGRVEMITDHISGFNGTSVLCKSGREIPADIVVMATGLNLQLLGGASVEVDGEPVAVAEKLVYKAVMVEGVPNAAMIFGYTNATWTLKVNIACDYICRLLHHLDKHGYSKVMPKDQDDSTTDGSVFGGLNSGYVQRSAGVLPRQGSKLPWQVLHDFPKDSKMLCDAPIEDTHLEFSGQQSAAPGKLKTSAA